MHHFTSDIIQALVRKEDISEIFRSHLEDAVNTLLKTELTAFLDYEKYERFGFNSGNSRNGDYTRTLHTEYGVIELKIPRDRNGDFKQQTISNMTQTVEANVEAFRERTLEKQYVCIYLDATFLFTFYH